MRIVMPVSLAFVLLMDAEVNSFVTITPLNQKTECFVGVPNRSRTLHFIKNRFDEETEEIKIRNKTEEDEENLKSFIKHVGRSPDRQKNTNDFSGNTNQGASSLPFSEEISKALLSPQTEILDTFLVLASSLFVALGTLPASSIPQGFDYFILFVEDALTYFFGFGFFLRWYGVGKLSLEYLSKPLALLDIVVSVIPLISIIPVLGFMNIPASLLPNSALVNLRLLRILRLARVLTDLETFGKFETALGLKPSDVKSYQLELAKVLLSIFTLLSVATGLIYSAEHEYNPQIPDYFTALYFGLTTLTTVGFGDITPVTFNGRLVVMASILFGVAVIPAQAARLFEALLEFQEERRKQNQSIERKDKSSENKRGKIFMSEDDDIIKESDLQNLLNQRNQAEGAILDPRISCQNCGARSHRVDALHCFSCGEKLL